MSFFFIVEEHEAAINGWLSDMKEKAGEVLMEESVIHIKEEYSTWDWILEGMLERAGFRIKRTESVMPNTMAYICVK